MLNRHVQTICANNSDELHTCGTLKNTNFGLNQHEKFNLSEPLEWRLLVINLFKFKAYDKQASLLFPAIQTNTYGEYNALPYYRNSFCRT